MADRLKLDKRNRAYVRVGASVTSVLSGEDDVRTWDDEELALGRRRGPSGKFGGQPPRVIPTACLRELNRRKLFDTESAIRESCVDAARYLAAVAAGTEEPNPARMRACEMVLDRFLGKPVDRIQMNGNVDMNVSIENAPWAVALRNSVRAGIEGAAPTPEAASEEDIVDAEVVELCACGCGQPPASGSLYFNPKHQAHARSKVQPLPGPALEADDPITEPDDGDDFIEE